jgi:hypothetical protein
MHVPWDRASLEELLRELVSRGEMSKVDLKSTFDVASTPAQGELLKDISAIANTYNHHYRNHGFIIFGCQNNKITCTAFPGNEDHVQATIDDLVRHYVGPFVTTHLYIFNHKGKQWGTLVIPPTRSAPHVFINNIHKRSKGDIYVRSGTITEKAQPGDYARFFRQHLEEHTYEFQRSISDLQSDVSALSAELKKIKTRKAPAKPTTTKSAKREAVIEPHAEPGSITETVESLLAKHEDPIAKGLLSEVRKIHDLLAATDIPWDINTVNKQQIQDILSKLEQVGVEYWSAISALVLRDETGRYDDAVIQSVTYLARQIEAPAHTPFTAWGTNFRYLPLVVTLYLITIIGVAKKRAGLLSRLFKINLEGRSHYDEPVPIAYILFFIRRADEIFQPLHSGYPQQRWCDAVASYVKSLIDRILNPDVFLWDKEREFFTGEFVLCLSPIDIVDKTSKRPMLGHPSSGLYVYFSEAEPIIKRFLGNEKKFLAEIFDRPLREILSEFDSTARNLQKSGCWASGFVGGAVEAAFPEKKI